MIRVGFVALALLLLVTTGADAQQKVLAFGDSVTAGVGDTVETEQGYPTRLQRLLRGAGLTDATVVNRGEGGETTLEGLGRISSVLEEGGDFILIMEGTNDVSQRISPESIAFNLGKMVDRSESAGVTPVLATIIPLTPIAFTTSDFELAKLLRQQAVSRGIDLADQYAAFDLFPNAWPDLYSNLISNDPVGHPNGDGYDVIAQLFADVLLDLDTLPPVLGDVSPPDGSSDVSKTATITVVLFDHGEGIDTANTRLLINGAEVSPQRSGTTAKTVYQYTSAEPLQGVVLVQVDAVDRALPANRALILATQFSTVGTTFFKGDINRDGRVDGFDLASLASSFGRSRGSFRYRPENDLDKNGRVDGADLAILANNFGKSSS